MDLTSDWHGAEEEPGRSLREGLAASWRAESCWRRPGSNGKRGLVAQIVSLQPVPSCPGIFHASEMRRVRTRGCAVGCHRTC